MSNKDREKRNAYKRDYRQKNLERVRAEDERFRERRNRDPRRQLQRVMFMTLYDSDRRLASHEAQLGAMYASDESERTERRGMFSYKIVSSA